MTNHLDPKERTEHLIRVALDVARRDGWRSLTHASVASAAMVSPALVVARLGTKPAMLRTVMRAAVRQRVAAVVAQGLAVGDKHACSADAALREECAALVRNA